MKLSVVIPAYNEERTIRQVLERVRAVDLAPVEKEVLVVDDGSKDRTAELARAVPGVTVIRHERNGGKGAAVRTGIHAAGGDIVIIQDADLEYDPQDFPAMIAPILAGETDVVIGSRFVHERPRFFLGKRRSPYFMHYVGNLAIVALTNLLYRKSFTDYEGCYKAFRRSTLIAVPVNATGFEFDNELLCKLFRRGVRAREVPIRYAPRSYASGKKITWRHGVVMLWTIVKWRFAPIR